MRGTMEGFTVQISMGEGVKYRLVRLTVQIRFISSAREIVQYRSVLLSVYWRVYITVQVSHIIGVVKGVQFIV